MDYRKGSVASRLRGSDRIEVAAKARWFWPVPISATARGGGEFDQFTLNAVFSQDTGATGQGASAVGGIN